MIVLWGIAWFFALGACAPSVVIEDPKDEGWPMPNPASAGLPNPASYTVDATNDTVTDNVTGLMWQRTVDDHMFAKHLWSKAIDHCANLEHGGHDDWRLPSRIELVSLVDFTSGAPSIDTNAFPDTPNAEFWTSSHIEINISAAWVVFFGNATTYLLGVVPYPYVVRCVRLGHADTPKGHYTIINGAVYDPKRKLTWQQTISPSSFTWSQAQVYCSSLELAGAGWRVPSMKELQTIVDETRRSPSIELNTFPDTPPDWFWTSSLMGSTPPLSWYVDFNNGYADVGSEVTDTGRVRCVR